MKNKYCKWCNFLHIDHCVFEGCSEFSCVLTPNRKQFLDAAEFEARVSKSLLERMNDIYDMGNLDGLENVRSDYPCICNELKLARLSVEEEMDAEDTVRISKSCQTDR